MRTRDAWIPERPHSYDALSNRQWRSLQRKLAFVSDPFSSDITLAELENRKPL
jgi:hypothetical protein